MNSRKELKEFIRKNRIDLRVFINHEFCRCNSKLTIIDANNAEATIRCSDAYMNETTYTFGIVHEFIKNEWEHVGCDGRNLIVIDNQPVSIYQDLIDRIEALKLKQIEIAI